MVFCKKFCILLAFVAVVSTKTTVAQSVNMLEACDRSLGHLRPRLMLIGGQKCGTSSLFSDLTRQSAVSMGRTLVSTACRFRHDPKECNVFTIHTTLQAKSLGYGSDFCRNDGSTHNYCARLRARPLKSSNDFLVAYDRCAWKNNTGGDDNTCQYAVIPHLRNNKTSHAHKDSWQEFCAPMVGLDASPTYLSRPHVPGTLRSVLGWEHASRTRFVASLRDPVTRTVSYFNHAVENNWASLRKRFKREEHFSFGRWATEEIQKVQACTNFSSSKAEYNKLPTPDGTVLRPWPDCGILGLNAGLYAWQLELWFKHFRPHQFLIVSFEETFRDNRTSGPRQHYLTIVREVLQFVIESQSGSMRDNKANAPLAIAASTQGISKRASFSHRNFDNASSADMEMLRDFFAPHNRRLRGLLRRNAVAIAPNGMSAESLIAEWGS